MDKRKHKPVVHSPCLSIDTFCPICEGGLVLCSICKLAEGSLTTECPGEDSLKRLDAVYNQYIDFREGRWIINEKVFGR